jgi:hypothetical protein
MNEGVGACIRVVKEINYEYVNEAGDMERDDERLLRE